MPLFNSSCRTSFAMVPESMLVLSQEKDKSDCLFEHPNGTSCLLASLSLGRIFQNKRTIRVSKLQVNEFHIPLPNPSVSSCAKEAELTFGHLVVLQTSCNNYVLYHEHAVS